MAVVSFFSSSLINPKHKSSLFLWLYMLCSMPSISISFVLYDGALFELFELLNKLFMQLVAFFFPPPLHVCVCLYVNGTCQ